MKVVKGGKVSIDLAIEVAVRAHERQCRKGTKIPYITHPLAVGIILAKAGCSDEVIIAGILHDTVEDTSITLEDISEKFGEKVAGIVEGASEPDKTLSWEKRKEHTIEYLKTAPLEVRLVTCADKLHNMRSIVNDRLNGATHDRRNGAIFRIAKKRFSDWPKTSVFHPLSNWYF